MKKRNLLFFLFFALIIQSAIGAPRNVILIIPDGCSIAIWATIRAMTVGTDGDLNVDKLPVQSRVRTYSADAMITCSASAATAYSCGIKSRNGVIGMDANTVFGDSLTGAPVESITQKAIKAGLSTGIVTTTHLMHATPAAFYAHRASRNWFELLAGDMAVSNVDVLLGGGRQFILPKGTRDVTGVESSRSDNRNIVQEMVNKGYIYVENRTDFKNIDPSKTSRLLGLFNASHMSYEHDRRREDIDEPSLAEMTDKALNILSRNRNGFFLMVEAGRIDLAAHQHDTERVLWDAIACDQAVGVALEFARNNRNTLLIVVSDHGTGAPHLVGFYENPGDEEPVAKDIFPVLALDEGGFPIENQPDWPALAWGPWKGHTGEDIGLHAFGPGSERLTGLNDNTHIFYVMAEHLGLINQAGRMNFIKRIR